MFLHVFNGLWLGTKGIILTVIILIGAAFGLGKLDSYRRRRNLLLYGVWNPPPRRNFLHYLGDIWNFLFTTGR